MAESRRIGAIYLVRLIRLAQHTTTLLPMPADGFYTVGRAERRQQVWSPVNPALHQTGKAWQPVSVGLVILSMQGGPKCNGGGSITVPPPYKVEPINTAAQGSASCPAGKAGWSRNVTNQVQNQDGSPYAKSGVSVSDTISVGSTNGLGIASTQTGTSTTTGDGSFPDTYFVCSPACPNSTAESDALQSWVVGGSTLPHSNSVVYKCSSITVDGF